MSRLFAEEFVVPLLPGEPEAAEVRYDETYALNVLPDGRPFIAASQAGGTVTLTKVRDEASDADAPGDAGSPTLRITTKIDTEYVDFAPNASLGTTTDTRVREEADDADRDARSGEDFFHLGTETRTSVREEADDMDRNAWVGEGLSILRTRTHAFAPDGFGPALLVP